MTFAQSSGAFSVGLSASEEEGGLAVAHGLGCGEPLPLSLFLTLVRV